MVLRSTKIQQVFVLSEAALAWAPRRAPDFGITPLSATPGWSVPAKQFYTRFSVLSPNKPYSTQVFFVFKNASSRASAWNLLSTWIQ